MAKSLRIGFLRGVAGVLTVALALSASAAEKKRVAVKAFAAKGVEASAASVLENEFCSAFPTADYSILCSDDVRSLMQHKQTEMNIGKCDDDESCAQQVAKVADASLVVSGEVSRIGDLFVVNASLLDTSNNRVLGRGKASAAKLEDLINKMGEVAKQMLAAK